MSRSPRKGMRLRTMGALGRKKCSGAGRAARIVSRIVSIGMASLPTVAIASPSAGLPRDRLAASFQSIIVERAVMVGEIVAFVGLVSLVLGFAFGARKPTYFGFVALGVYLTLFYSFGLGLALLVVGLFLLSAHGAESHSREWHERPQAEGVRKQGSSRG